MKTVGVILPGTGELVRVEDPEGVAEALGTIDALIEQLKAAKRAVTEAAIEQSMELGTRTLTLEDGRKVVLTSAEATVYDPDELRVALLEAGMPDARVDEIVVPTVTYRVNASKAKAAAGANPSYKQAIEANTKVEPRTVYASVKA